MRKRTVIACLLCGVAIIIALNAVRHTLTIRPYTVRVDGAIAPTGQMPYPNIIVSNPSSLWQALLVLPNAPAGPGVKFRWTTLKLETANAASVPHLAITAFPSNAVPSQVVHISTNEAFTRVFTPDIAPDNVPQVAFRFVCSCESIDTLGAKLTSWANKHASSFVRVPNLARIGGPVTSQWYTITAPTSPPPAAASAP
jgi:hypothetical protein